MNQRKEANFGSWERLLLQDLERSLGELGVAFWRHLLEKLRAGQSWCTESEWGVSLRAREGRRQVSSEFRVSHWRVDRLGGAQRSPEVPCMVHFWHRTGAKTGAGQCL